MDLPNAEFPPPNRRFIDVPQTITDINTENGESNNLRIVCYACSTFSEDLLVVMNSIDKKVLWFHRKANYLI